jgi:hypothetical protein
MPVQVICPNLRCRRVLSVPDDVRGKMVKCQQCQTSLRVPMLPQKSHAAGYGRSAPSSGSSANS